MSAHIKPKEKHMDEKAKPTAALRLGNDEMQRIMENEARAMFSDKMMRLLFKEDKKEVSAQVLMKKWLWKCYQDFLLEKEMNKDPQAVENPAENND